MNKKIYYLLFFLAIIILVIKLLPNKVENDSSSGELESQISRDQVIVIGTVGEVPADEVKEYQPFIDYVAEKLAPYGIKKGEVVVAKSPAEMSKFMRQGKVDMYIDSPFPVYVVSKLAEAKVLVDRWKKGEEKYYTIIFAKKSAGIKTLSDLKGKTIAFESPYSTSGYFLPKSELIKRGFILKEREGLNEKVGPNEIGYYFTNDQDKVTEDVLSGVTLVGAQNQKDVESVAKEDYSDFDVVFKSIDLYRHIIVTRKDFSEDLRLNLKRLMVGMHESAEGQEVLKNFKGTTKFGSFDDPNEAFTGVAELSALVEKEIVRQ